MEKDIVEAHFIVKGRVQGVGFRAKVHFYATKLKIAGTVCNLPDGSVEIYAQGKQSAVDQLLAHVQNDIGPDYVDAIIKEYQTPTQSIESFSIVYAPRST